MQMTPQEELQKALADVESARAELAAAKAEIEAAESGKAPKNAAKKTAAKPKRPTRPAKRPVHQSGLVSGCYGTGERFPSDTRLRLDMTPVVTKQYDPMSRPNEYKHEGVECLLVFDIMNGFKDSDSWKRCKCLDCVELRRM
jgi:sRNA-binding protein